MTKRERETLARKLTSLETRVGKKRDELRKLLDEFEPLLDSVRDGVEGIDSSIGYLREARDQLDAAADTLSQYA